MLIKRLDLATDTMVEVHVCPMCLKQSLASHGSVGREAKTWNQDEGRYEPIVFIRWSCKDCGFKWLE